MTTVQIRVALLLEGIDKPKVKQLSINRMKKQLLKIGCLLSVLFLFTSCVKDDVAYLVVKLEDTESFYSRYEVSHLGSWCLCEDKQLSEYISNDGGSRSNIEKIIFPSNYVKSKLLKGESFGGLTPKNVSIPSSVTEIGDGAFSGCSSLTSIEIPSSVTKIGDEAFRECRSLTSIEIGSGVTEIGSKAFYNCSHLTSIEIPSSVTKIGDEAFRYCSRLTSIEIGSGVTEIGSYAFDDCSSLTSIEIPSRVTKIGDGAFGHCSSLTSMFVWIGNSKYDSRDNCNAIIESSSNTLISGCKSTTIPSSVTEIGDGAFRYCTSLTSIEIPSSVTKIGDEAFQLCTSLTSIEIPSSVTKIGSYAFSGCSSLTSINLLPRVTKIGDGAFMGCSSLEGIHIPLFVTEIGNWAFKDCSNLQLIYMEPTIPPTLLLFNTIEVLSNCPANILVPFDSGNAYKNARGWRKYASRIFEYSF